MHKSEKKPKKAWRILVQIIIWHCTSKISTKVSTKSKQLKKLYGYRKSTVLDLKVGKFKFLLVQGGGYKVKWSFFQCREWVFIR